MTDPNLRCQVASAMVDALPPIPDGTCIGDIAIDMVDVILFIAAELVPRSLSAHAEREPQRFMYRSLVMNGPAAKKQSLKHLICSKEFEESD